LYGLAAIQQANGWAMAGAGACIVLTGLAVLSLLISMIPRLTGLLEKKAPPPAESPTEADQPEMIVPDKLPDDIAAASTIYISLTEDLGASFSLVDLHRKSKKVGLPHPHLSINRFRDAGILAAVGEGNFTWKPLSD
jgi:hypothetical protein